MKRFLSLFLITLFSILLTVFNPLISQSAFADANDFYFESGDFNYYLDKNSDGSSFMNVEETLTAVFPYFDQNHGIERCIPRFYNHVDTLKNANFQVLRNGLNEPFEISNDGTFTCLRIGSASSYVHGSQTYKISYRLENVILNPDNSELQELYWDVNGDGWSQYFNNLTATLTLSDSLKSAWKGTASCYVGKFGTSGSAATSRCKIEKSDSSIFFKTISDKSRKSYDPEAKEEYFFEGVMSGETMTIDLEFSPKTFTVKEPKKSYLFFIFLGIFFGLILVGIYFWIKAENKIKGKKSLAKSKIISPEFTPMNGMTPAEMSEIYLKSTGSSRVASLLDLAVKKHISLEKGEKKLLGGFKWKIHIKNIDHIPTEERIVLQIINGGKEVHNSDIIEVKNHTATYSLEKLSRSFDTSVKSSLKNKHLLENSKEKNSNLVALILFLFIFFFPIVIMIISSAFSSLSNEVIYVGASYIIPIISIGLFLCIFIAILIAVHISKYSCRTLEGIKASKYMDGLKRYMTLAEKDRISFLQSVSGVDTSPTGIVKLYEKLLPYAVLFNLEDSWLKELNKYYEVENIHNDWATTGAIISASDFRSFTSYTSSSISSSTSYSSSSSGGGGGGSSGGGGGGGGGGGW